jgi:hypothetical protein
MKHQDEVIRRAKDLAEAVNEARHMEKMMFDCPKDSIDVALEKFEEAYEAYENNKRNA